VSSGGSSTASEKVTLLVPGALLLEVSLTRAQALPEAVAGTDYRRILDGGLRGLYRENTG